MGGNPSGLPILQGKERGLRRAIETTNETTRTDRTASPSTKFISSQRKKSLSQPYDRDFQVRSECCQNRWQPVFPQKGWDAPVPVFHRNACVPGSRRFLTLTWVTNTDVAIPLTVTIDANIFIRQ